MKNLLKIAVLALVLSCFSAYSILLDDFQFNSQKLENIRKVSSVPPIICSSEDAALWAEREYGWRAEGVSYDGLNQAWMIYMILHDGSKSHRMTVDVPTNHSCNFEHTARRVIRRLRQMILEKNVEEAGQIVERLKQLAEEFE